MSLTIVAPATALGNCVAYRKQNMTARITTKTKRRAMDWGLALVSQSIETTIVYSEDEGWGLVVPAEEHKRALEVIGLYRKENLRWPWRRTISQHDFLFDWGALAWVFLICIFFWLEESQTNLRTAGVMSADAVLHGEWWRLFTAIFLHANLAHLVANASIGLVMLGLAMGAYGTGIGLLAALLAGAGGNVLCLLLNDGHQRLGASGMVMGALGLLAIRSIQVSADGRSHTRNLLMTPAKTQKSKPTRQYLLRSLAAGVMLFALLGTSPDSDVIGHLGGFLTGTCIGGFLMVKPRLAQNLTANITSGLVFCSLVIISWWVALNNRN